MEESQKDQRIAEIASEQMEALRPMLESWTMDGLERLSLVECIRRYEAKFLLGRSLEPDRLIPLIARIWDCLKRGLNCREFEELIGRNAALRRYRGLSQWPDARKRVVRDYVVELSAQLAKDMLFFQTVGLIGHVEETGSRFDRDHSE